MLSYQITSFDTDIHHITFSERTRPGSNQDQRKEVLNVLKEEIAGRFFEKEYILPFLLFDVNRIFHTYGEDERLHFLHRLKNIVLSQSAIVIGDQSIKGIFDDFFQNTGWDNKVVFAENQDTALQMAKTLKEKRDTPPAKEHILLQARTPLLLLYNLLSRLRYEFGKESSAYHNHLISSRRLISLIREEQFAELETMILNKDKKLEEIWATYSTQTFTIKDLMLYFNFDHFDKLDFVMKDKLRFYLSLISAAVTMAEKTAGRNNFHKAYDYIDAVHLLPETLLGDSLDEADFWKSRRWFYDSLEGEVRGTAELYLHEKKLSL